MQHPSQQWPASERFLCLCCLLAIVLITFLFPSFFFYSLSLLGNDNDDDNGGTIGGISAPDLIEQVGWAKESGGKCSGCTRTGKRNQGRNLISSSLTSRRSRLVLFFCILFPFIRMAFTGVDFPQILGFGMSSPCDWGISFRNV